MTATPGPLPAISERTQLRVPIITVVTAILLALAGGLWFVYQRTERIAVIESRIEDVRDSIRDLRDLIRSKP
jgi:hypothetical protein